VEGTAGSGQGLALLLPFSCLGFGCSSAIQIASRTVFPVSDSLCGVTGAFPLLTLTVAINIFGFQSPSAFCISHHSLLPFLVFLACFLVDLSLILLLNFER
jgi:hypothetical protein